ncbi:MAG: histidine phosphatase family protein [bacterium]|nr:histidine phosphatase family protein [bacterium]
MKRLYLVRHAKSSWKDYSLKDFERPLNKRGQRDAPVMGQRLATQNICPDLIVGSPAKRALTTAKIIAHEMKYPETKIVTNDAIYEAGPSNLLHMIQQLDDPAEQVMLVGHNPGFTMLAEELCSEEFDNIPTCGIVCIDFDAASWKKIEYGKGTLIFFDYPKKAQAL